MQIIINADDFGFDEDTAQATIDLFENGALTSATLMVSMPARDRALSFAKSNPQFSFGCHLTWVGDGLERALSPPHEIPSLAHPDGRLRDSQEIRLKALKGKLPVREIAQETAAQLALMRDYGVDVSHVDSHGHMHKFGPFRLALEQVLPQFRIRRVRRVQNLYLKRPLRSPTFWLGAYWDAALMRKFASTDAFYMGTGVDGAPWFQTLLTKAEARGVGTLEVGVHPGSGSGWRADESTSATALAREALARGHLLVPFYSLSDS